MFVFFNRVVRQNPGGGGGGGGGTILSIESRMAIP